MALPRLADYLPEESSDALKKALERYIADLENFPGLAEDDVASAVREIEAEQALHQNALLLAEYELAKLRLLKLRDRLLVGEAQEMSADTFWETPLRR